MRRHRLPVDVYNRCVTFLYGTHKEINRYLDGLPDLGPDTISMAVSGKSLVLTVDGFESDFICVIKQGRRDRQIAVLAHEVLHHVCHVLRRADLPLTDDSEEAYTYYHEYVLRLCLERMK